MFIFGVKEEPSLKVIFFTVLVRKNRSGFDLTIIKIALFSILGLIFMHYHGEKDDF